MPFASSYGYGGLQIKNAFGWVHLALPPAEMTKESQGFRLFIGLK